MAVFSISNVEIKGVAACVPPFVDENRKSALMSPDEMEKLIGSIGVDRQVELEERRDRMSDICIPDAGLYSAGNLLLASGKAGFIPGVLYAGCLSGLLRLGIWAECDFRFDG